MSPHLIPRRNRTRRRRGRPLRLGHYLCPTCGAITTRTLIAEHGTTYLVACDCGYRLEEHRP